VPIPLGFRNLKEENAFISECRKPKPECAYPVPGKPAMAFCIEKWLAWIQHPSNGFRLQSYWKIMPQRNDAQ
jgi:hypothetical protein